MRLPGRRAESGDIVLLVDGLTKRYRAPSGWVGVEDASFEVASGEVVGLVGLNGAGKTTTIRAVLGLCQPDGGRALVDGRPLGAWSDPARRVGAVLGPVGMLPGLSGWENLMVLAIGSGLSREAVGECLEEAGLGEHAGKRVRGYSLGMRQRLSIAAALLGDPGNLVLDEPVGGLDPAGVRWVRTLLRERASGAAPCSSPPTCWPSRPRWRTAMW